MQAWASSSYKGPGLSEPLEVLGGQVGPATGPLNPSTSIGSGEDTSQVDPSRKSLNPQLPPVLMPHEVERFWARIAQSDGCWVWTGAIGPKGYGVINIGGKPHGRTLRTHRVALYLKTGQWSTQLQVCHHCDNPPCCNPAHLFLGTGKRNAHDRNTRGKVRQRTTTTRRLIEAAPEMLAALKLYFSDPPRFHKAASDAIAKAEGR